MNMFAKKHELYRNYMHEFLKDVGSGNKYQEQTVDLVADTYCDSYINSNDVKWINLIDGVDESDLSAGFVIIGKSGNSKHPYSSYSIAQVYVDPKYRNKHKAADVLVDYIKRHEGLWSVQLHKQHPYALKYVDRVFELAGYQRRSIEQAVDDEEYVWYGYLKRRN